MTSNFISVPEVAHAGENHGDAMLVGRCDHLVVAHAAAWLDDCSGASFYNHIEDVAEREEGVGGHHRPGQLEASVVCLDRGDAGAVDSAHLSGAHGERSACAAEHDSVRLDELGDAP